jgi:hypothetical protein
MIRSVLVVAVAFVGSMPVQAARAAANGPGDGHGAVVAGGLSSERSGREVR